MANKSIVIALAKSTARKLANKPFGVIHSNGSQDVTVTDINDFYLINPPNVLGLVRDVELQNNTLSLTKSTPVKISFNVTGESSTTIPHNVSVWLFKNNINTPNEVQLAKVIEQGVTRKNIPITLTGFTIDDGQVGDYYYAKFKSTITMDCIIDNLSLVLEGI